MTNKSPKVSQASQTVAMQKELLTADELARYLEVETASVLEWAERGKIPAVREGNFWKFDRSKIDEWVSNEKIK
jgi:PTS system nitrogen regulatory IIA component